MTQKYVEELRNLIYWSLTNEFPDRGKSHVVGEQIACCIALIRHGLKLYNPEYFAIFSRTLLGEPNAALIGEVEKNDDDEQYGGGEDEDNEGEDSVE